MVSQSFKNHISNLLSSKVKIVQPISGGDISFAYKISTNSGVYFLKVNDNPEALRMFQTEAKALNIILDTNTIKTPTIIDVGTIDYVHFLLMEFVEAKSPNQKDMALFGKQLAKMHQVSTNTFGLNFGNFIGSLPQSNKKHQNWNDFYIDERLVPQLQLANQKGLLHQSEIPETERMKSVCLKYFQNIKPSLLHGDLWSGNYVISKDGEPYLIDPAVYYGHSEVDIAMSKLFGGFGNEFYNTYYSIFPEDSNTGARIEIYQLYYLLVHLNLFGSSYHRSVVSILKKYFNHC